MNKTILIGRLTRDPELKYTEEKGTAVCKFTLAVDRIGGKDKNEADFITCVAFGKRGETIAQYLSKGRQLAVEGELRTGSYVANDGTKKYTTDVWVENFDFLGANKPKDETQFNEAM